MVQNLVVVPKNNLQFSRLLASSNSSLVIITVEKRHLTEKLKFILMTFFECFYSLEF